MAYTPINWQTGDTITAAKLNRCDNGWAVESTQLFSETVTTAGQGELYSAAFAYQTGPIDGDAITVTFGGTDYECVRIDAFGGYYYGGFGEYGPDFTDYPFCISSDMRSGNMIYTASAGTYTVSASVDGVECGAGFTTAVSSVNEQLGVMIPLKLIVNETTENEAITALESDRLVFFKIGTRSMHFVSSVNTGTGIVSFTPDAAGVTAGFDANTKTFYIGGN